MTMIAALFVQSPGVYVGLPNVDPWPETRDARLYAGPYPVVAHPPCARWGNYWFGSPSSSKRFALGDDGGCFASALASVRRYGGVLEHPKDSQAWAYFNLTKPPPEGGWVHADLFGGWTCRVDQGQYGHRAQKATWLYWNSRGRAKPPELDWTRTPPGDFPLERLSKRERAATPVEFRDLLLDLAETARNRGPETE